MQTRPIIIIGKKEDVDTAIKIVQQRFLVCLRRNRPPYKRDVAEVTLICLNTAYILTIFYFISKSRVNLLNYKQPPYKYFTFLSMLYLSISLCSLTVAQKLCTINGMTIMAGSLLYPLTFPISDILTEIYGYKKTQTVIWFSFAFQILFASLCLAIVNIKSPDSYAHASDYALVLGNLLRIATGSLIASILGTFLNIYLISKSKIMLSGKLFGLRSLFSSLAGEFLYTFIAIAIMSYGVVPLDSLLTLIALSMLIKIIYNLITIIPASLTVIFLKNKNEEINTEEEYLKNNLSELNTVIEVIDGR